MKKRIKLLRSTEEIGITVSPKGKLVVSEYDAAGKETSRRVQLGENLVLKRKP